MSTKLLKPQSKQKNMAFIGVYVPQWIHEYLNMYLVAHKINKSDLLRGIIEDWINKEGPDSKDELKRLLIEEGKKHWKTTKTLNKEAQLFLFKKKFEKELQAKHLHQSDITFIVEHIE